MHRRIGFFILVGTSVLALGVLTWRSPGSQLRREPVSTAVELEAAIVEIEAGRRTTPLIGEPAAGGDAPVTFLAKRTDGRVPRIVSDVTGWGEHTDGTFDFTVGAMTRIGRTEWYSLRATVAPRARIEYLIAYDLADHRLDRHNPRQAAGPRFGGAPVSEFVMPGYLPPQEFADSPVPAAGLLTEAAVESRVGAGEWRLTVYTPAGYRGDGHYPVAVILDLRSGQMSRVRQALADAGDTVDYTEVPEGHSAVTWTNHLRTVLVNLFGPGSANTSPPGG